MAEDVDRVYAVTDQELDPFVAREIARTGSDTRRALEGWALDHGVSGGGGSGTTTIIGAAPFTITDLGDGTGVLEVTGPGARIEDHGMWFELIITDGGTA